MRRSQVAIRMAVAASGSGNDPWTTWPTANLVL